MVSVAAIAVKIALKTMSNVFKGKSADQELTMQQVIQSKILNLAIGLVSILVGGLSLITIAKTGVTAACAAVTALVLYGCFEEIGKSVNDKFDEVANNITDFIISNVKKLFLPQSCQV
ncbi:hypothetical protein [Wolbachia endosymbiont of Ctenocephalides felis wCfeJ]|uniref:hypothetical protein n=1 Tax=Wolbachia endosymbiont of Ctenocephalides felis wCfeJ TaxID=2732594 RepID=UPI001FE31D7C|nr:hypothetical protein [Wolbachia endosymbiont of Ctenocephalides felis wCfeJ]WCR57704.1 MAG: hypothetical protein PG980_000176 [Wolbachia endosymbiont of Ctenocephalides felis wCfeJ]